MESVSVTFWNASQLWAAAAARERWRRQLAEQSMTKSVDKLAWLVAEVDLFRPTVVVLVEVTMNWEELKIFKAWAKR